jgi:hypothetical protein
VSDFRAEQQLGILGNSELHKRLAANLQLDVVPRPDGSSRGLVVVAQHPSDVKTLLDNKSMPFVAVITWNLSESSVHMLLDLGIPVFIGEPTYVSFYEAMDNPEEAVKALSETERPTIARFAAVEASLNARGRGDTAASLTIDGDES